MSASAASATTHASSSSKPSQAQQSATAHASSSSKPSQARYVAPVQWVKAPTDGDKWVYSAMGCVPCLVAILLALGIIVCGTAGHHSERAKAAMRSSGPLILGAIVVALGVFLVLIRLMMGMGKSTAQTSGEPPCAAALVAQPAAPQAFLARGQRQAANAHSAMTRKLHKDIDAIAHSRRGFWYPSAI